MHLLTVIQDDRSRGERMLRIIKNKRADSQESTFRFIVIGIGLTLIFAAVVLSLFWGWNKATAKTVTGKIDMLADYDNDGIINQYDKCCAASCNPKGEEINIDMTSRWYGCASWQDYTPCTTDISVQCNGRAIPDPTLDYDKDGVQNQYDKCCAASCAPKAGETVDQSPNSPKQGCTQNQAPTTICSMDPNVPCNTVQVS